MLGTRLSLIGTTITSGEETWINYEAVQPSSLNVLVELVHHTEVLGVDHQDGKLDDLLGLDLYSVKTGRFKVQYKKVFELLRPETQS